mmetsp:Transcript_90954/g.161080  ORF Transcript_90954/g.161080 Transcript_90954/m.161080 type:complete len:519 (-) Transcript_90954:174-1730(-)
MSEQIMQSRRPAGASAKPIARYETSTSRRAREAFNHDRVRKNTFLKCCSEEFVDRVVAQLEVALFTEGDEIVKEGEAANVLYFLIVGQVEVLTGPTLQTVKQLPAGSVFGELALFQKNCKRTATVTALEFCDCRAINHTVFRKILQQFPEDQVRLRTSSSIRLAELNKIKEDKQRAGSHSVWKAVIKSAMACRNIIDRRRSWPVSLKLGSEREAAQEALQESNGTPKEAERATETKQGSSENYLTKPGREEGLSSAEDDEAVAQVSEALQDVGGCARVLGVSLPELSPHTHGSNTSHFPFGAKANPDEEHRRKARKAEDSLTCLQPDAEFNGFDSSYDSGVPSGFRQKSAPGKRAQEMSHLEHILMPMEELDVPQQSWTQAVSMPASVTSQGCDSMRPTSSGNCGQLLSTWRQSSKPLSSASTSSTDRPQLPPRIRRPVSKTTEAETQFPQIDSRPAHRRSCFAKIVPQAAEADRGRKHRQHSDKSNMMKIIKAVKEARLPSLRERGVAVGRHQVASG